MRWNEFALGLAAAFVCGGGALAAEGPPPASAFGRLPAIEDVDISPDGQKVAYLGGAGGQRFIAIAPVDGAKVVTVPLGADVVRSVRWAGNGYVLVNTSVLDKVRDGAEYRYHLARDFVLTADGKVITYLLKDYAPSGLATALPVLQVVDGAKPIAMVLGLDVSSSALLGADDTHIRSTQGDMANPFVTTLFRVDVATGAGQTIEHGSLLTSGWDVDLQGQPRVRFESDFRHGSRQILTRAKGASSWKLMAQTADDARQPLPTYLGYSDPEDSVYLLESSGGEEHVVRHALASGAASPVAQADGKVVTGMAVDPYTGEALGLITEADRGAVVWFDASLGALYAKLERAFSDKAVEFRAWSKDRGRIVVAVEAPDLPPKWFLLDAAKGQVSPIGSAYPELEGVKFGETRWIPYKARDGLQMGAYVTFPPAGGAEGKRPLVVLPHGGPGARDEYGFDWWAQFLATRGYVVLQPQFRGSSGFGRAFQDAGAREWAGKMQTDLLDGVAVLAAQGLIDPSRVCIVGASYGGYAALAGVAFHPDAYRCAVSVNGVSDLARLQGEHLRDYGPDSAGVSSLQSMVGSTLKGDDLAAGSPDQFAAKVKAPVLLIVSSDDTTVPTEQTAAMKAALDSARKPVELVTLQGDDHYLSHAATRTQMLEAIDGFLARNLPASP